MPVELLYIGFNQDYSCFACGTSGGFRVYGSEPVQEKFRREFGQGGIGMVQLLFRCNIIAVVGGGLTPKYPQYKVMIWDDHQGRCVGELSFRSQVRSVKMRRDKIVVALEHKIYVYNFANLQLTAQFETLSNPYGLLEVSSLSDSTILACPGLHAGQVRIENFERKFTKFISAHESSLSIIALSLNGKILATSSERGTLIRIWRTEDGQQLQELRRGTEHAHIYSIALSLKCDYLALSSDKGTVHIFQLSNEVQETYNGHNISVSSDAAGTNIGRQSSAYQEDEETSSHTNEQHTQHKESEKHMSGASGMLKAVQNVIPWRMISSEYSFAKIPLPQNTPSAVGFGPTPYTVIILCQDGYMYSIKFDPNERGKVYKQAREKFFEFENDTQNASYDAQGQDPKASHEENLTALEQPKEEHI